MDLAYIGLLGTLIGVALSYLGYKRGQRDEQERLKDRYKAEGGTEATLKTDIDYIKRRTDDMLLEQRETNKNIHTLSERLTRVEESTKSAHKRIDNIIDSYRDNKKDKDIIDTQ